MGLDYTALPGTVTFAAGSTTATINVAPLNDTQGEFDETVSVVLTFPSDGSYQIDLNSYWGTATITDDDGGIPSVSIAPATQSISEAGPGTATLTLTRTGGNLSAPLTVNYYAFGSATADVDYTALTGTVTFAAGSATATIAVAPLEDTLGELDENVSVYLAYPFDGSYQVDFTAYSATVTITDNDGGIPSVSIAPATQSISEAGPGTATLTLTRTGGNLTAPLTVNYYAFGSATADVDYTALTGTVTFAAGSATATIAVAPLEDTLGELDENVSVYLAYPFDGSYQVDFTAYSATVTITDNDGGIPTVTLVATAPSVSEAGPGTATLTLTRTGGNLAAPLTVNYFSFGSAFAGQDYSALPGAVTFAAGSATATIDVVPINDTQGEHDETVTVYLAYSYEGNYQIDFNAYWGTVTIVDDDGGIPIVSMAPAMQSVSEAGPGPATLTLTRTGGNLAEPLTVNYSAYGDATADVDYAALPGTVTFAAGSTTATIPITPLNDTQGEPDESVSVYLGYSFDGSYDVDSAAYASTVTITDDDGGIPTVSIAPAAQSISEASPGAAMFTITRTGGNLSVPLTVMYYVSGDATADVDYTALPGIVTFAAGVDSAFLNVVPINDTAGEYDETVTISLSYSFDGSYQVDPFNYLGTATITDDDGGIAVVSIAASDASAGESGHNNGEFTVSRSGGNLHQDLVVLYWVTGTAENGVDYVYLGGYVVIKANASSASIAINPLSDYQTEGTEDVTIYLTYGDGYTLDASSYFATLTIADKV